MKDRILIGVAVALPLLAVLYVLSPGESDNTNSDVPPLILEVVPQGYDLRVPFPEGEFHSSREYFVFLGDVCGTCGHPELLDGLNKIPQSTPLTFLVSSDYSERDLRNVRANYRIAHSVIRAPEKFEAIPAVGTVAITQGNVPVLESVDGIVSRSQVIPQDVRLVLSFIQPDLE